MGRLNQWSQHKRPLPDWQPEPILETLPDDLKNLPAVRHLGELNFPPGDGPDLQQTVWLSAIAERVRGQATQPLEIAQALFDWVVRNEQIERDANVHVPHMPREILILGRGTVADRAWIFSLLARQQGLDVVELAIAGRRAARMNLAFGCLCAVCRWRTVFVRCATGLADRGPGCAKPVVSPR